MRFLKNNCKLSNVRKVNSILATVKIQQTSSKIAQWVKEVYSQARGYKFNLQKPCKGKKRTYYIDVSPHLHRSAVEVGEATHTTTHTANIQNRGNNNNRQEKKLPDPKENKNYEKNDYQ